MAASTVTRDTWTNDTGSAAVPAADGTILNNAALQNNIYARIDAMFAGAGAYSTFTLGGILAVEGFGTHSFSAGGAGANALIVTNTTSGAGNFGLVRAVGGTTVGQIAAFSQGYTTGTYDVQASVGFYGNGAGGISIAADNAAGVIRFYTGGTTLRTTISATGTLIHAYALAFSGVLSPADFGGVNQNNYNPAGLATAAVLRLTNVGGAAVLSGITAQPAGTVLMLVNLGSSSITLNDEDTNSSAANRFALSAAKILATDDGALIWYDGTSSRWRILGAV